MPRFFVAAPKKGVPTTFTPQRTGRPEPAVMYVEGTILEPGDPTLPGARKLSDLKSQHFDALTQSLVLRVGPHTFAIGPEVILGLPDTTEIALHIRYLSASAG